MKKLIIFSRLDGTLLDAENNSYNSAMPALGLIRDKDIPLVLSTGKTRAETEYFMQIMDVHHPFITEFGSAIYIPKKYFDFPVDYQRETTEYFVIELGVRYESILSVINKARDLFGDKIITYGTSSPDVVQNLTKLSKEILPLAMQREYSDTLVLEGTETELDSVQMLVEQEGLTLTRRGRYIHICKKSEKAALQILTAFYRQKYDNQIITVGLGVTLSDQETIEATEHPVIVQDKGGRHDARILLPNLSKAKGIGPIGWNEFIVGALQNERELSEYFWFQENTFHAQDFSDIGKLIEKKLQLGVTISLALPTLNEERTIGEIIRILKEELMIRFPLVDEIVLIDSTSSDSTREIAKKYDIPVYIHHNILVEAGSHDGKGEALWKSLHVLKGDMIVWLDTDVSNMHPKFAYGLIGALLEKPSLKYVKAYYQRPQKTETHDQGGGRTTELAARPLFNLLFPDLSGIIQPLSGEYAGWRTALESLPFFSGYGVETGLLIDIYRKYGLHSIAQINLDERIHRSQDLHSLSKQAFAVTQVFLKRFMEQFCSDMGELINCSMKMVKMYGDRLYLEDTEIREIERPPIRTIEAYQKEHFKKN